MASEPLDRMLGARGYAKDSLAPVVDVTYGAQGGWQPNLRELNSNTPYLRKPTICLLVNYPRAFDYMDDKDVLIQMLRSLVEEQATEISGINFGLNPDFQRINVGGAGFQQAAPSNMTRTVPTPSFTWNEKTNKPITQFIEYWQTGLMMDPDTKFARLIHNADGRVPQQILDDYYSMTCAFIEPDATGRRVVEAAIIRNMMPASGVPREMTRNLPEGGTLLDINMDFTGVPDVNYGARLQCQRFLDDLRLSGANPNNRQAFVDRIDANVLAAQRGFKPSVDAAARYRPGVTAS